MSRVVLIAGMCQQVPPIEDAVYIGIDRGALCCVKQAVPMLCAVGDFDSVTQEEVSFIQANTTMLPLPEHKNETDTEVAIHHAMRQGYEEIILYGGLGGRMDHELANLYLLMHRRLPITLMDDKNRIRLLKPGSYRMQREYTYLSFLALEESCISEHGVAYPLDHRVLTCQDIYAISNEIIDQIASIELHYGCMLMIEADD